MWATHRLLFIIGFSICLASAINVNHPRRDNVLHFKFESELAVPKQAEVENIKAFEGNSTCAIRTFFCSHNRTCCRGKNNTFVCCTYPQGVCCQDGVHCCPRATRCDLAKQVCYRETFNGREIVARFIETDSVALTLIPEKPELLPKTSVVKVDSVVCPGGQSQCRDGQTCCRMSSGDFGCCPVPKAVCCSDNKHCCPEGYKCDGSSGACTKGSDIIKWLIKEPAHTVDSNLKDVPCDSSHFCPSGDTCCKLASGQWGCCPSPNAVCCDDHVHCCPSGYTCQAGQCSRGSNVMEWLTKTPAKTVDSEVKGVQCDASHSCPDGNTCCKLASGQWGCCPLPQAVCCADHVHCCPQDYKCGAGSCSKGDDVIEWFTKTPAKTVDSKVTYVQCDKTHFCYDNNTCCRVASGHFGCCPRPKAVCCDDHVNCCPHGYKCVPGACAKGNHVIERLIKVPAMTVESEVKDVQCDASHACPDGNTCCKLASGQWGCCPIPQAVCCADHVHCCPQGYTCGAGSCMKGSNVIEWFTKTPAKTVDSEVKDVQCDATHYCPDGNTCCKLASGQFGCCPSPQAVCCADHVHCCPQGYTCGAGSCMKGNNVIEWFTKTPAKTVDSEVKYVQCDATHYCPDGNTCCKLASGQFGCCPSPQAVCCADHVHCCPQGYTCGAGSCMKGNNVIEWFTKTPAKTVDSEVKYVQCDATHYCPDGNTCCKLASGQFGCCPSPQAVCCADHVHCCPQGYTCGAGSCMKGNNVIEWFTRTPAKTVDSEVKDVQCDATHSCPDGNTCCKLASGQWGCCPLPQAVCCADHVHCCPQDYKCGAGSCSKGDDVIEWFTKTPAKTVDSKVTYVQCDKTHFCYDNNTCCRVASGHFGCCPRPKAVCCDDHVNCCPHGYKCVPGACAKGNHVIERLIKVPAMTVESEVKDVQCDASHACPDGNTCCKLASGQWGCCPIPQAVCCADHVHCCPQGYTCGAGSCMKGSNVIEWFTKTPAKTVDSEVKDVQCDATHYCPDGNTCCKLASGQFGCCPSPQAVCCADHVHCCPQGYTCGAGSCMKGNNVIEWFTKTPAKTVDSEVKYVQCDATHYCPDGNTCCKLASGQFGCCPSPQAVCCADHVHCCPQGYTCGAGSCMKGNNVIEWFTKTPAKTVDSEVKYVQCDATHYCPDGNTCCKLASGQFGCCPSPQAVCCADHVHCCPQGYTCGAGSCMKGNNVIEWFTKTPAKTVDSEVKYVQCDATHYCPDGNTCCKLASGQFGCCPSPQAVCCADHVHCCPQGYTCGAGSCMKGNNVIEWFTKTPAKTVDSEVKYVQCDATHYCPDGNTCCKLASGQFGCCPSPQAVCCADHVHCCPQGYTCGAGSCMKGNNVIEWFTRTPAKTVDSEVKDVQCDATHSCPDGNTCCKLASGQWGCCPLPQAVCCADHVHCCPQDYKCGAGSCSKGDDVIEWFTKTPAKTVDSKVTYVQCDKTHFCYDNNTCCRVASGHFGCCPRPKAVCCDDHVNCCPHGYKCVPGACAKGNHVIERLIKVPAMTVESEVKDVQCDASHACPDGNTCCKLASGQWGCCPIPQAVCCADHVHCCPQGYTCGAGSCMKGSNVIEWFTKTPAKTVDSEVKDVQCDATHYCPDGNTCCKLASGQFGCCPSPQAVCCADHVHCCPQGYTCGAGSCMKGNNVIEWFTKTPAKTVDSEVKYVQCDATHYCPDGNTCCKLASGQFGCCPSPQAVCCADHVHCCPQGYTCGAGSCMKGNNVIEWFTKTPAKTVDSEVKYVQCDATHYCPDGNTCCKLASGQFGCCPSPQAVCCADHVHCCPQGYTCGAGSCMKGNNVIEWFTRTPAKTVDSEVKDVQCDATHSCPDGNTCCKLASGQWGCCPLPQAVCCADHVHCCPQDYKCGAGSCSKGDDVIEWFTKTPAKTVDSKVTYVQCDKTHFCYDNNTCCRVASGHFGCCPRPKAVCCDDHVNCCPHGYKCVPGACAKGNHVIERLIKVPAMTVESEVKDVQCDASHACPDGNTCCKLASGQWGCCPIPQAVCCADHVHCCPQGYTCGAGSCMKGNNVIEWFTKTPAKTVDSEVKDVQCDATHYCPDGNTCCKLASGQFGCCPSPQAVCCADHVHCCPQGYTCGAGSCMKGNNVIEWFTKTPAKTVDSEVKDVQCDATHYCPDGNTCCKLASGQFGCCPSPQAVCCADHVHCCPQGYTCGAGSCMKGNNVIEWFTKTPAKTVDSEVKYVQCDATHYCPDGNTCCKLASGQFGCCPSPQAVCCADHVHCCPQGYTCGAGSCMKGNNVIEWFTKTPAKTVDSEVKDVQCDATHYCPDGNTCCKLASGQFGCCPSPQAVCCADHVHCCPQGYTCGAGSCMKGNNVIEWFTKTPAKTVDSEVKYVQCDATHYCPDGNTCCKLASGQFGCCPSPQAVCCADHVHCCPQGYTCGAGSCMKGNNVIEWFTKTPAKTVDSEVKYVQCDATHYCPDGNTCCKLASGQFGCCPSPQAVCCSDHVHCCPSGYKCSTSTGSCTKDGVSIPWLAKRGANLVGKP